MKICMIGDSHLAMIVEAHKARATTDCALSAVTWPRECEDEFALDGSTLVANGPALAAFWHSGGLPDRIDVTGFDKVVLVSHTLTAFNVFAILREHAVTGWTASQPIIDTLFANEPDLKARRLLTPAAFQECLVGMIQSNHAYRIAAHLRQHCTVPMVVAPPPFLVEDALTHRPKLFALRRILQSRDGEAYAQSYNDAHRAAFASLADVRVVTQPPQTITQGCLTKVGYRKGARRFGTDIAHKENDIMHAGPAFGGLLLDQFLDVSSETQV